MIFIKSGVQFDPIAPAGFLILQAIRTASKMMDLDLMITSGSDGAHSGANDPHKTGEAYDIRSHDLDPAIKQNVLDTIMSGLETGKFFGYLEAPGQLNEHFHVQRSKGTTLSVEEFLNG